MARIDNGEVGALQPEHYPARDARPIRAESAKNSAAARGKGLRVEGWKFYDRGRSWFLTFAALVRTGSAASCKHTAVPTSEDQNAIHMRVGMAGAPLGSLLHTKRSKRPLSSC
jgi:hypothetical protein